MPPTSRRIDRVLRAGADGKLDANYFPDLPPSRVEGLTDLIAKVGSYGTPATDYGVSLEAADNTAALEAAAAAQTTTEGRRLIHLPPGVLHGHLPMSEGVVWVFNGTTLKFPATGPARHLVQPSDMATWGDPGSWTTGAPGPHRSGLAGHGVLDGQSSEWGIWPAPTATVPTAAFTGVGSLAAGTYGYRVSYLTAFGTATPSDPVTITTATSGRVELTWVNPAEAADKQVVIFGRHQNNRRYQRVMATLPAGTTSFIDDGTVTPSGQTAQDIDVSAPSCLLGGSETLVDGLVIKDMPGTGLVTRYESQAVRADTGALPTADVRNLTILRTGAEGLNFIGPAHTEFRNIKIRHAGRHSAADTKAVRSHIQAFEMGPVHFEGVQTSGYGFYGLEAHTNFTTRGCVFSGASIAQIGMFAHGEVRDTKISDPEGAVAVGIRVGAPWIAPKASLRGLRVEGFSDTTGIAVDLREAFPGCAASGTIVQDTGTPVAGADDHFTDFTILGNAQGDYVPRQVAIVRENTPHVVGRSADSRYYAATPNDGTTALQQALAAVSSTGGEVYVREGDYHVGAALTIPAGVTLRMASTKAQLIALTSLGSGTIIVAREDSTIIGGTFNGNKSGGATCNAIGLIGSRAQALRTHVKNTDKAAYFAWGGGNIDGVRFTDCHAVDNANLGIQINSMVSGARVTGCDVSGSDKGITLGGSRATVLDCVLTATTGNSIEVTGTENKVADSRFYDSGGEGILVSASLTHIDGCTFRNPTYRGVLLSSGQRIEVLNSSVTNAGSAGFRVSSGASRWAIIGCSSSDDRQFKDTDTGISIYGSIGLIDGCTARNADHQGDGIYVDSSVTASVTLGNNKTT